MDSVGGLPLVCTDTTSPKNWASNTFVVGVAIAMAGYGIFKFSSENEWRHQSPIHPIPSQMVCKVEGVGC